MAVDVGDRAPPFARTAHNGEEARVGPDADKLTVLYFYPKDETSGCTAEARRFRDVYERFTDAGAIVIGVSPDSDASHRAFADNHALPFLLVSDADGSLRKAYGVKRTLGLVPGRVTFVIDRSGIVRHTFDSQLRATKHVDEALAAVRRAT
jgi:peroxiredoxin Q/BCP